MKALVTGAHGFIGSHLVDKLLSEGHRVTALVSPWGTLQNLEAALAGVQLVRADITEPETLGDAFEEVEVVFHAAARVSDYGAAAHFEKVNVEGTANVLRAAERAGVKRLVLVSSVAVHRYSGFRHADPRTQPLDGTLNAYARSKVAAETLLRGAQLEVVVVRPGLLPFGTRDPNLQRVAAALKTGIFPLVAGGRAVFNTAYCKNLVEGLMLAGTVREAAGRSYVIGEAEAVSWRVFLDELAARLGAPKPRFRLPGWIAEPLGESVERVWGVARPTLEPPLTRYRGALMRRDVHFSLRAAREELGYRPRITWQEGLAESVRSLG